jgi:hypothetical protein
MSKTVDGSQPLSFWVQVGSASLSLSLSLQQIFEASSFLFNSELVATGTSGL